MRVYEVPISYYGRTYQEKKEVVKDGLLALYYILTSQLSYQPEIFLSANPPAARLARRLC